MKIRFYTNSKEAIVFDLEDILKQLNIEEQVATVGLVIEKTRPRLRQSLRQYKTIIRTCISRQKNTDGI